MFLLSGALGMGRHLVTDGGRRDPGVPPLPSLPALGQACHGHFPGRQPLYLPSPSITEPVLPTCLGTCMFLLTL